MAIVRDPVCGMMIESERAAAQTTYNGEKYYFCADQCLRQFQADPARYAHAELADQAPREEHEGPLDALGKLKYGSAGSGGAEFEPPPAPDAKHD